MSKVAKGLGIVMFTLVINIGAAAAAGHGGGMAVGGWHSGAWHSGGWHGGGYRGHHFGGGYYGANGDPYYDTPNYHIESIGDVSTSHPLGPVMPPSFDLGCRRSQEIVAVPSEDGGDRQIKIIRC
jgi:hypothetical protein